MNPSRDFVRFAGTLTGKVPFRANDAALRSPDRLGSFGRMLVWGKGEPVANRADRPLLAPLEKLRKGHVESPCDTLEHVDAGIALALSLIHICKANAVPRGGFAVCRPLRIVGCMRVSCCLDYE